MAYEDNLDKIQMGLAAGGMVPGPTGIVSDLADAGISLGRGDLLAALLAGGAAIPGLGMAFGGRHLGKLGKARKLAGGGGKLPHGMLPEEVAMLRQADEGADLERAMTGGEEVRKISSAEEATQWGDELLADEPRIDEWYSRGDDPEKIFGKDISEFNLSASRQAGATREEISASYEELLDMAKGPTEDRNAAAARTLLLNDDGLDLYIVGRKSGNPPEESAKAAVDNIDMRGIDEAEASAMGPLTPAEEQFNSYMGSQRPTQADSFRDQGEQDLLRQMTEAERLGGEEDFPYPFREPPMSEAEQIAEFERTQRADALAASREAAAQRLTPEEKARVIEDMRMRRPATD